MTLAEIFTKKHVIEEKNAFKCTLMYIFYQIMNAHIKHRAELLAVRNVHKILLLEDILSILTLIFKILLLFSSHTENKPLNYQKYKMML